MLDLEFDEVRLVEVLLHEQARRRIKLPSAMVAPDPEWILGFPKAAQTFAGFPEAFHSLEAALEKAQSRLGRVLASVAV